MVGVFLLYSLIIELTQKYTERKDKLDVADEVSLIRTTVIAKFRLDVSLNSVQHVKR